MPAALFDHIQKFVSLNAEDLELLAQYITVKTIAKKEVILNEGQRCDAQYFIVKGCVRIFTITENGTEQITHFGIENWWVSDYLSLEAKSPSHFFIQAVEASTIVVLNRVLQDELFIKLPQLERYFRMVAQKALGASMMRIYYLYLQTAEERYRHFANSFPEFIQWIPQYMLASYLGFTPEFLSKVRGKKI
ncbi:MAG: Crp/Fnr family transcriptional regulator [Chitinophagaceae bacterium]